MKFSSPYQNKTFKSIWLEHFQPEGELLAQEFITGVEFCKSRTALLWTNVGSTNTKGVSYGVNPKGDLGPLKNKVLLINDVPDLHAPEARSVHGFRFKKVPQYPGFFCDFGACTTLEDYMAEQISKRTSSKLRNYRNRLHRDHKITYRMVWGDISVEEYETLFEQFHSLLHKRFEDKQIVNNNLDPSEWQFYKAVTFPMLKDKEAGMFVTYVEGRPVAITLLNFSGDRAFDVIRVFDIAFSKYRIGTLSLMEQIAWCIGNNFKILDFSKGFYEYKKQWSNSSYMFEYHIWYDSRNLKSNLLARTLALKFILKFWARKYNLQETVHKIRYRFRPKS